MEILHDVIAKRNNPFCVVLRHFRRDAEKSRVEVDVANPKHKHLFGPDQVPETEADHGDISAHLPFVEIVEDSFPVLFGYGDPAFGLPLFPFERGERITRNKTFGDKRPEYAFQELKHAVVGVGAPPTLAIFV